MKIDELVKVFQIKYPIMVNEMKGSSHHYSEDNLNPYHLEGDVWTHTMMVMNEAKKAHLNPINSLVCLLHDIGKPTCRVLNHQKKRVHFFGHESMSAFMSLDIMKDLGLSKDEIVRGFQLIALHTELFKLTPDQVQVRFRNNMHLLQNLLKISTCDREGRFHEDTHEVYPSFLPKAKLNKEYKNEVIMLIGLPCSGKSTWITENEKDGDFIISRDSIIEKAFPDLTYNEAFVKIDQNLVNIELDRQFSLTKDKERVIIDMTNLSRKSRRKRLSRFSKFKKTAIVFLTSMSEIEKRNTNREGKFIEINVYDRMIKSFYPPMFDEFDEIIWKLS